MGQLFRAGRLSYSLRTTHESAVNEDKSTRYHRLRRRSDLLGTALVGAMLLAVSLSGMAAACRTATEGVTAWLPLLLAPGAHTLLFLAGLAVAVQALELPGAWYQGYWLERRYGLSTQGLSHWLSDHVKAVTATSALMVAGAWALYVCIQRWPDLWWLVAASGCTVAMVALACLAPMLLLPFFYRVHALGRASLSERLVRLAERAGAPVMEVSGWAIGGHTRKANAALAGVGRSRRILISDTMLDAYSDEEIEVVVAHELGHYVHHDLWLAMLLRALTLYGGFFVAAQALAVAAPWLELRGPADVAGAPVLLLVAGAWACAMSPIGNAVSRAQERRADRYALRLTGNPVAFVAAIRRLAQQNLAEDRPSALARTLFYSHPPMRERIAAAEAWHGVARPLPAHGIMGAGE